MCAENGLINDSSVYLWEKNFARRLMSGASFPDQVFSRELQRFTFFNFDDFFTRDLFESLIQFLRQNSVETFTLFTLQPDPEDYFYKKFSCYPILQGSTEWTSERYLSLVFADPGESPADAIAHNSTELVLHSDSVDWCMYGSRDFEVGILGANDESLIASWRSVYPKCFDAESVIDAVLGPAWGSSKVPPEYVEKLLLNYRS
jgi:hypothetical protein